jgi:hypothetical protein
MHFPSLDSLVDKSTATFRRFPLAVIAAIIGSCFAILILHLPYNLQETHHYYWNAVWSCYLGMLLFIVLEVYSERIGLTAGKKLVSRFCGIVVVLLYYFLLPDYFMQISIIRFALFSLGFHLLTAFAPFIGRNEPNGFWQYNKIIFLRILTSVLYSGVLFIGLALAILAIDQLFKADIDGKTYGDLWIIIAGIFNTWFFLAGFPKDYSALEEQTDYPKGLKVFTQYVLLPIITVYLLILYAYLFKIMFTAQLPVGWVSYLVLGFSIAGILSLLLIHPVRNDEDNKWILIFSRFFYFALFPLIILLFFSIKRRINDYGITENRYFVLVLALWLLLIAVYFLFSRAKNIKIIPVSLCLLAFLTSFGPWGAFYVSLHSQEKHLAEILGRNNMLSGGKVTRSLSKISFEDHKEISSVVEYITEVHGYESLQPFFVQNLDSMIKADSTDRRYSYAQVNKILEIMNVSYVGNYQTENEESKRISYTAEPASTLSISGYDYFISDFTINRYSMNDTSCVSYMIDKTSLTVCFDAKKNQLSIRDRSSEAVLLFDVGALIKTIKDSNYTNDNPVKPGIMTLTSGNELFSAKIFFRNVYGEIYSDTIKLSRIQADIMIKSGEKNENEVGERK